VAPLRRKAIHSKLLISKRNREFLFSGGTQKTAIYYRFWAQFENLGELVKNTIFVA